MLVKKNFVQGGSALDFRSKENESEARRELRRRGQHNVQILPVGAPSQQAAKASVSRRPRAAARLSS
jgi:hypothetical protein